MRIDVDPKGVGRTYHIYWRALPKGREDGRLVMGPWAHGDWGGKDGDKLGNVKFYAKTAAFYREHIELPFFRQFLKGDTNSPLPEAYMFVTGLNQWRRFDAWPPRAAHEQTLYFHPGGNLTFAPPTESAPKVSP